MAKDKDKQLNPAAAQLKASKASAIKKQKAQIAAQRQQRLATRNPKHLSNQIASLKEEKEAGGGKLSTQQQRRLEQLEKEVTGVQKAREKLGANAPSLKDGRGAEQRGEKRKYEHRERGPNPNMSSLGRDRGRGWGKEETESEDTDPDVRMIPMPRNTPPPVPPKPRRRRELDDDESKPSVRPSDEALPPPVRTGPHPLPAKPNVVVKKEYSSAPVIRDLRKEATAAFVPAAVLKRRQELEKEKARLKEPEELERLEAEESEQEGRDGGYRAATVADGGEEDEDELKRFLGEVDMKDSEGQDVDSRHEADEGGGSDQEIEVQPTKEFEVGRGIIAPATAKPKMALVEDYNSDDD